MITSNKVINIMKEQCWGLIKKDVADVTNGKPEIKEQEEKVILVSEKPMLEVLLASDAYYGTVQFIKDLVSVLFIPFAIIRAIPEAVSICFYTLLKRTFVSYDKRMKKSSALRNKKKDKEEQAKCI